MRQSARLLLATALLASLATPAAACPWCGSRFSGDGIDRQSSSDNSEDGKFRVSFVDHLTGATSTIEVEDDTMDLPKKVGFTCKLLKADDDGKRKLECRREKEAVDASYACGSGAPASANLPDKRGMTAVTIVLDCGGTPKA